MRLNIISNLSNGAGLQRDYLLLKGMLEAKGHSVAGVMYDAKPPYPAADINIWLEIMPSPSWGLLPVALDAAPRNWVIPNPEWWYGELWDQYLPRLERILCKTEDSLRIFRQKLARHNWADRAQFVGFEALDFYRPEIERQPRFLHMAGKSETKNTAAVMEAWQRHQLPYPLTVVAWKPNIASLCRGQNVTHVERVDEADMPRMMNEHLFHVMPSKYEGFGHYIHEALGCGGVVITTNAPPMNGFAGVARELLIPVAQTQTMRSATAHLVSGAGVALAVRKAVSLGKERIGQIATAAREAFLADREQFRAAFGALI